MSESMSQAHPGAPATAPTPEREGQDSLPRDTLDKLLRWRARHQPTERAFDFLDESGEETTSVSYAELDQHGRAVAARLGEAGAAGERVLLLLPPGLPFVSSLLGCLYAGAVAVPAFPPLSPGHIQRLRGIILDAAPRIALLPRAYLSAIQMVGLPAERLQEIECIAFEECTLDHASRWRPVDGIASSSLAMLQYTSGSTSEPKGVMLTHDNLLHNLRIMTEGFPLRAQRSRAVIWLPPYHDMGLIGGIMSPLYAGIPALMMSPMTFLRRPILWLRALSRYRGTISGGPNFAFELAVRKTTPEEREGLDLSCWENAFTGAEPVRATTLKRFARTFAPYGFQAAAFCPCYGLAEATLMVSGKHFIEPPRIEYFDAAALSQAQAKVIGAGQEGGRALVSNGIVQGDQDVRIVDADSGRVCPDGQIGEIWVRSISVAMGYWGKEEETARSFAGTLAGESHGAYLRTGDLGFFHDGELFLAARLKDLIIIRGENYYPQDIEAILDTCGDALRPGRGVAFAIEDEGDERLVIVQEISGPLPGEAANALLERIRQHVVREIGVSPWSIALVARGSLPLTSSGKLRRMATRAAFLAEELDLVASWRHSFAAQDRERDVPAHITVIGSKDAATLESWLLARVAGHLKVAASEIDPEESFTALGIDSVTAADLLAHLEEAMSTSVSPAMFYEHASIRALARHLAQGGR